MKLLEISSLGELPVWVQAFGYLAAVFLIPASKMVIGYFTESQGKIISNKEEALSKCLNDCDTLMQKNIENEIIISDMKERLAMIDGKLLILRQVLIKEGFEIEI